MRCKKVEKLLPAYVDGELPERLARRVEQHLGRCERCASLLELHRGPLAQWKGLESYGPSTNLWPGIAAEIAAKQTRPRRYWLNDLRQPVFGLPAPAVGAVMFALAVAVGLFAYRSTHTPGPGEKPVIPVARTAEAPPETAQDAPQIFQAVATVLSETRKPSVDELLPAKAELVNRAVLELQSDPFLSQQLKPLLDDVEIALTELSAAGSSPSQKTIQEVQKLIQQKKLLVRLAVARSVLNALTEAEEMPPELLAAYLQPPR